MVRGPELIQRGWCAVGAPGFPVRRILLHDPPRGDALIGALVRVNPERKAHRTQRLRRAIRRKTNQIRHLNFAGSYCHPHTDQRKEHERCDECRDEQQEFAEAPHACTNEHVTVIVPRRPIGGPG